MKKTNFSSFDKALEIGADEVLNLVKKSSLEGRGGACFPTHLKWELTKKEKDPIKYLVCNFDEGEPGTFKDKYIGENNPEIIIEGIAIACFTMGIKNAYIYLRGEYKHIKPLLENAIKKYKEKIKKINNLTIEIFVGAGSYVCGDETAIISSIEGERGEPKSKPPFPAEKGLFSHPTCINNVETLANIPLIIRGDWKNLRLFCLSGNVQKGGVYELKESYPLKNLLEKAKPLKKIKAVFLGCSGGCIKYNVDIKLEKNFNPIIVVDIDQSIPKICLEISKFFMHESCGKCIPCREGCIRQKELLEDIIFLKKDRDKTISILEDLSNCMSKTSFCGLGKTAGCYILSALKNFKEDFFQCK